MTMVIRNPGYIAYFYELRVNFSQAIIKRHHCEETATAEEAKAHGIRGREQVGDVGAVQGDEADDLDSAEEDDW